MLKPFALPWKYLVCADWGQRSDSAVMEIEEDEAGQLFKKVVISWPVNV
jgi:hypothetical protein